MRTPSGSRRVSAHVVKPCAGSLMFNWSMFSPIKPLQQRHVRLFASSHRATPPSQEGSGNQDGNPWRVSRVGNMIRRGRSRLGHKLQPTETLCWVNKQLVVLLDPKRSRLLYVVGAAPVADDKTLKQLETVIKAANVSAAYFYGETNSALFQPLREMVSKDLHLFTFTCPSSNLENQEELEEQGHDTVQPEATRLSFPDPLFSRLKRSDMHLMKYYRAYTGTEGPRLSSQRKMDWGNFLFSLRQAKTEGIAWAEGIALIQNRDILPEEEDGLSEYYNCDIQLGPSPDDFTIRVHTKHDDQGARPQLERCLRDESNYLDDMSRLEEQWQGPSVLDKDWGDAQRGATTTGRAKVQGNAVVGKDDDSSEEDSEVTDSESQNPTRISADSASEEEEELGPRLIARPQRQPQENAVRSIRSTGSSRGGSRSSELSAASVSPESNNSDLSKDLELAELLFGRKATLKEVDQLKAALAQALEVDNDTAGRNSRLQQAIMGIQNSSSVSKASPKPIERRRQRRRRLTVPNAVHQLANGGKLFTSLGPDEIPETIRRLGDTNEGPSSAAVSCLRWLRVPSSHVYARGQDIILVVQQSLLGPIADEWDRMERRLMVQ